jgi:hypothetical protein
MGSGAAVRIFIVADMKLIRLCEGVTDLVNLATDGSLRVKSAG